MSIDVIAARHANTARLLVSAATEFSPASVYEEADGLESICTIPAYYPAETQNVLAEEIAQMWQDREDLLAVLAKVEEWVAKFETSQSSDQAKRENAQFDLGHSSGRRAAGSILRGVLDKSGQ